MKTVEKIDYAKAVLAYVRGEAVDVDEVLLLTGKSWSQFANDTEATRELQFKQAVLAELKAIRQLLEKNNGPHPKSRRRSRAAAPRKQD